MPNKASDADVQIAAWNQPLAIDPTKRKALNRDPLGITIEQSRTLYTLLYPMMAQDFKHRDDLYAYIVALKKEIEALRKDTNQQLATLKQQINAHVHVGNLGSPTAPPTTPVTGVVIKALNEDTTESKPFFDAADSHVKPEKIGTIEFTRRNSLKNTYVVTSKKLIETILVKDAKSIIPFDVGEKDSALDSTANFVPNKTKVDLI